MLDVTQGLLTLPQAAKILGRHPDTLRAWAAKGKLQTVEVAGHRYTTVAALQAMAGPVQVVDVESPAQRRKRERDLRERLRKMGV